MIQLAIETSIRDFSICLRIGQQTFQNRCETPEARASANLLPQIDAALKQANRRPDEVEAISISIGPGSFTGLRLGVATAKTLAWALDRPIYSVPSHAVIACQAAQTLLSEPASKTRQIAAVIDAQRGQWFSQVFELDGKGDFAPREPFSLVEPQTFLNSLENPTLVSGPGLQRWHQKLKKNTPFELTEPQHWTPRASSVAELVCSRTDNASPVDAMQLVPVYGRKSAAEEKLLAGELK